MSNEEEMLFKLYGITGYASSVGVQDDTVCADKADGVCDGEG